MLDPQLVEQLAGHLEKVTTSVRLVATLDDGPKSAELDELLTEIAGLSDSITLDRNGNDTRRPSFSIERVGSDVAIRFAAVPLGHEFTSFVLALLQVGGHPSTAAPEILDRIRSLEPADGEALRFETFVSLSCQNCPDVVQALNLMSIHNPHIEHVTIDGALVPDEVEERGVMAVPAVYLNGERFEQGRVGLEDIVARLDTGAVAAVAERLDAEAPFDVLIVGGGPAGASAAVYAARKGMRTGLVADRFGGQLLDTLGIENLISVSYTEGPRLASELEQNVREHDVELITAQEVMRLHPAPSPRALHRLDLRSGATLEAHTVVVSTGARWRQIGVPGEAEYANRGVAYCPHCDGPLYADKRVAVVGGGNSGVEAALDLAGIAAHVTLIEFDDQLRADDVLQAKLRTLPNVDVRLNAETTEVLGDGDRVTGLSVRDRRDGGVDRLDLEGVFVQIGLLPNTEWLDGTVDLTESGEVVIDDRGQTSTPGVFAAGDCTTEPFKQIVVAIGAGSTAMLGAYDHLIRSSATDTAA
ncbi:MAG: alkyl hydroperoxide reductase subunit F [Ilumatobacteraceae bacterium]|nr:alkyl hydroperoxide reductase subunit F [Ilumatobacteraceae bacterium]